MLKLLIKILFSFFIFLMISSNQKEILNNNYNANQNFIFEIHRHLESSFQKETAIYILKKNCPELEINDVQNFKNFIEFNTFSGFIEKWSKFTKCLKNYEDFYFITIENLKSLSLKGVKYVEFMYSPDYFLEKANLDPLLLTNEIIKAAKDGEKYGIKCNFIINFARKPNDDLAIKIKLLDDLSQFYQGSSPRIVGIGLSGNEARFSSKNYVKLFENAKQFGLKTTVHTGESTNSTYIKESIDYLKPDRIGHGIKIIEDEILMEEIKEKNIHLEICPFGNLKTGVFKGKIEDHPIKKIFNSGIRISVNSDDPLFIGIDINDVWIKLKEINMFDEREINIIRDFTIEDSFMEDKEKEYFKNILLLENTKKE